MGGTTHDRGGEPLLVAGQVDKVYRTDEIEVEALVELDLTVHERRDAGWARARVGGGW